MLIQKNCALATCVMPFQNNVVFETLIVTVSLVVMK